MPNKNVGFFCAIGSAHAKLSDTECNTIKANYNTMRSNYTSGTVCGTSYVAMYDGRFAAFAGGICTCLANGSASSQCKAIDEMCCTGGPTNTSVGNNIYKIETHSFNSSSGTCTVSKTEYGCATGYYDTDGNFSTSGCTKCPPPDFYTNSALTNQWSATTAGIGKNAITACYASQGPTFYDKTGSFTLTNKCYY